jgi:hypothetical protein
VAFNLEDYEMVEERLKKWWADNPDGAIETDMIVDRPDYCVFIARIYRTHADTKPTSTGWARTVYGANRQTAEFGVELAETSAIGRSLANFIYSGKKRASREEMSKVGFGTSTLTVVPEVDAASFASTWEIYGDKKVKEPTQAAQAIALVQAELGAKPLPVAPMCQHGEMQRKMGVNAKGEYSGWVCAANGAPRAEQCPAKWDKK